MPPAEPGRIGRTTAGGEIIELVEEIHHEDRTLCFLIRAAYRPDDTQFLTDDEATLQGGHIVYPKGHEIPRHRHQPIERSIVGTPEVLVVREGRCEVQIYDDEENPVTKRELNQGDILMILGGGHGVRMLEDTVLFEVKQGPYPGPEEKEHF